jgi:hypothetical protein
MGQDRRIKVTLGGGKLPKREGGMRYVALVTPSKKDGKGKNQVDAPTIATGPDAKDFDWTWETAYEGEAIFMDGKYFSETYWWKIKISWNMEGLTRATHSQLIDKLTGYHLLRIDRCEVL